MAQVEAFNRWDCSNIKVEDPGLQRYINIKPVFVPRTGARYAGNRFHKSRIFIVERLINKVMNPGHKGKKHKITSGLCTGKSTTAYGLVEKAFKIIEQKLKKNPVEVFVKALENSAPREEIVAIEYGGARYPKSVECSPQRRIDVALRMMTQGAYQKAFNSKKKAETCLADEIIAAYQLSQSSNAIAKKLELERQADASK
ncbi:MAG: 30S ribosomal protein S7 [DPANN group archaeon]|nr:30S ribosomal protein S7 [DPANN group archaeon]